MALDGPFYTFCDDLWRAWLSDELEVTQLIRETFALNAAPEPYKFYDAGRRPLVALLSNPGAPMSHQLRDNILNRTSPVTATQTYSEAAPQFVEFYKRNLKGKPRERIVKLQRLSTLAGFDGLVVVESFPFHSSSLPMKQKVAMINEVSKSRILRAYIEVVRDFLKPQPTIIVSGAAPQKSLSAGDEYSTWIKWQSQLAGLSLAQSEFVPIVTNGAKVTVAARINTDSGVPKILVMMMGSTSLPKEPGLKMLADKVSVAGQ